MAGLFKKIFGFDFGSLNRGQIGYYGLLDWWDEVFTKEEQDYINSKCDSTNITTGETTKYSLDKGAFTLDGAGGGEEGFTAIRFLSVYGGYFMTSTYNHIARKFFDKAVSLINDNTHILTQHFLYTSMIQYNAGYSNEYRKNIFNKMLEIEAAVIPNLKYKKKLIASHQGYESMIDILEEEGQYDEAIELCKLGKKKGWQNNWDLRIERIKNREQNSYTVN